MSLKTVVRYLIAFVIVTLAFALIGPLVGVPRGMMFPPVFVYGNATGHTKGIVTRTHKEASSNPFRVGGYNDYVDIQFRAPYRPLFGSVQKTEPNHLYKGMCYVKDENFDKFKEGDVVPVKYDVGYPEINGIDLPYGGQHLIGTAYLFSSWLIFFLVIIVLAHVVSPFLERIMLRESY